MLKIKQMEQLKNKVAKIASAMKKIEEAAKSEINSNEEYLQVCGAMLAVTRNMYVEALGPQGASRMFQEVANTFMIQQELLEEFYYDDPPTIH
jgi:hypothetical protein|tara:strand:+ start:1268 stop:1546 length:279 start_codon:yes stop_codon:yes gene_type:complete